MVTIQTDDDGGEDDRTRRTVLGTAGIAAATLLAGCSGDGGGSGDSDGSTDSGDSGDGGGSGDSDGSTDSGDSGDGSDGMTALNACPMVPGSFTRFDPGDGPLPYSFEYPDIISMEYAKDGPDTLATVVNGLFERNTDEQYSVKGSINVKTGIQAEFSTRPGLVDAWYDERSNHETLLTTSINGEDVQFIGQFPEPGSGSELTTSFSEDRKAYAAMALVPYKFQYPNAGEQARYHRLSISTDIRLPETEVAPSCASNLLETLERSIESIKMNRDVEAFEERVKDYDPP
jgi:hypothetical protein